ncbi:glycosyl transferase, group 2 family protein,putative [Streptococcus pneumoniae]|uniref:glycosyltransferase family 2 protein n=1 Tax=Streptococcus pneumoniae TaxID=1313 RepID=UPI0005E548F7|nr:glycosyltransferase [Streptococcus pneumoniae]COF20846.1 CpsIbJ [Streptococcus pneumoniae]VJJ61049.1 glycosyl transferase, group 2 family protein,putative [Streptococcus pneumoniae]VNZ26061.1 glycosyl transferase, group 2 family protein,putative [Streptococcus pneumoniae]VPP83670.1 glycosyl transferase, group 2 family protein,putative [Streptococcus pneumoniae]VSB80046.1 glycosyl transferase, group 2 family protein,putative [Streptococcus pneumoniae]
MKISIIMGIHNGEKRFETAVQSIFNQTYDNWEFIICDDASTDKTFEKLQGLYGQDSRFILLKNEKNVGLSATLNRCIEASSGEFIARMDDDDICYPERFERQVDYLFHHPEIDFVSSSIDIFDGEVVVGTRISLDFPSKKDLIWNSPFVHPVTMFRRDALLEVGGYRVSPETVRGQDYDLFMRLYSREKKGGNILEPLFRYTIDQNTMKRRTFKARIGEMIIRYKGYRAMKVPFYNYVFIFKPLVAHLVTLVKRR